ncbi:8781_t:CDS:2 [Funneliformis mosseae]|uniref:8781_t:CDS:1 n=1 Tax=Funneliformis mosseae TaxID=27381 RepID=A0A9N9NB21_FUNMO|nr:8781_t:CDS:2 [Funneliformis mosseae]
MNADDEICVRGLSFFWLGVSIFDTPLSVTRSAKPDTDFRRAMNTVGGVISEWLRGDACTLGASLTKMVWSVGAFLEWSAPLPPLDSCVVT